MESRSRTSAAIGLIIGLISVSFASQAWARDVIPQYAVPTQGIQSLEPLSVPSPQYLGAPSPPKCCGLATPEVFCHDIDKYVALSIVRMFNSFTSYEFADPDPLGPNPISRLEFPLDEWWVGLKAGVSSLVLSISAEGLINLDKDAQPKFQDSDWLLQGDRWYIDDPRFPVAWTEDWGAANQKNIFSESNCRLESSSILDVNMDLNLTGLMSSYSNLKIGPVIGYRYQHFLFINQDGVQRYFPETQEIIVPIDPLDPFGPGVPTGEYYTYQPVELPGKGLHFAQKFQLYYVGGKCRGSFAPRFTMAGGYFPARIEIEAQADWAWVKAQTSDHHQLRIFRYTFEDTSGGGWHVGLKLNYLVPRTARFGIAGDFRRIDTTGSHMLMEGFNDLTWDRGVRVWSDQMTLAGNIELLW